MNLTELEFNLGEMGQERILDGGTVNGVRIEEANKQQLALYAYRADLLRKQIEEHEKVVKSNLHQVKLELARKMQDDGDSSFEQHMPDSTKVKFSLAANDHVSIRKEHQEDAHLWLFSQGMGSIVKDYVHPMTLKAQVNAYLKRDAELEDEFDEEIPSWVDLSDPESAEAWEDYKTNKKYLNVSAEEEIARRITELEQMRDKVRQVPLTLEPPDEAFTRFTEISTKLTYRRN